MLGLNRTDLNVTGITYLHGSPVDLTDIEFGNLVDWNPSPSYFGNIVLLPLNIGNTVNWRVHPDQFYGSPHFGNIFGQFGDFLLQEDGISLFVLEDGSGEILLEN